jgi:hypothetical protein
MSRSRDVHSDEVPGLAKAGYRDLMGSFLFRADGVGEIRTLSGTSLTMGIYEELEARGTLPDGQQ